MICRILISVLALVAVPLLLMPADAPAVAAAPVAAPAAIVQLPHVSVLAVGTGNAGSAVVMIPGLATPRAVWEPAAAALAAKGHRVFLVQVNGFAGEDPGANAQAGVLAGIVSDLHGYVAANRLEGAAVIGHSLGGLAGLMWAKAHPGDIGRLMVVDSLPYSGDMFMPNAQVAAIEPQAAAIRAGMAASYGKPADKASADQTAQRLALKPETRAQVSAWSMASDPRVVGQALYEDLTTDLRGDLANIATPVTLVYPWSEALPKDRADAFYKAEFAALPHVAYISVGDSAHFIMLDQPDAMQAAIDAFLK